MNDKMKDWIMKYVLVKKRLKNGLFIAIMLLCCACQPNRKPVEPGKLNVSEMMQPIGNESVFESDDYYTWGASPIKGTDGKYHLFYSRWKKEYGFLAWVTHSEIAHAVSEHATGPYRFSDLTLPPRGEGFWDGHNTHNPTIHFFDGKYYLYYTGNTGDGVNVKDGLNWSHRNNQRIGVAYADSPYGPWTLLDKPVIDVSADSTAHDALMMANPSITQMPDGKYLLVYKAVAKKKPMPFGGPVVHLCAVADTPLGPFRKVETPVFTATGSSFPAEDPYIWYQDHCYYAIVKDMKGSFSEFGQSLALFYSLDGFDWKLAENALVSKIQYQTKDGNVHPLKHLERPQLLIENGIPTALFVAADTMSDYSAGGHSFNIHIPLK